jgi:hypothetical protein
MVSLTLESYDYHFHGGHPAFSMGKFPGFQPFADGRDTIHLGKTSDVSGL